MTTVTPQSWAAALLTKLGAPVTQNNMISVLAWEEAEGGQWHNGAHWNPLNTTLDSAKYGSLPGNSAGVAVYPDYRTGLDETAKTLQEPRYASVLADLKRSAPPSSTTAAVAGSRWGTWQGVSPQPNVNTATAQVREHPGWVPKDPGTTAKDPTPKKPRSKQPASKGHMPPNPGAPNGVHDKIVLDIAELGRLDDVFHGFSIDISGVRSQLISLESDLQPALAALKDRNLANWITGMLGEITKTQWGFDSSARQCDDISVYCGQIRTLAQQADADDGARSGPSAVAAFVRSHPKPKHGAQGWEAVVAALGGGTIYRKDPTAPAPTKGSGTGPAASGSTRAKAASKVLALAATQKGIRETGVNDTKYGAWFGDNGAFWCGMYVSWVFAHAGMPLPAIDGSHGFDSVPHAITYGTEHHELDSTPQAGDIFLYKNGEHCGIVTKVFPDGSFETSEGNWSNQVFVQRRTNDGTYDFWNPYPSGATS